MLPAIGAVAGAALGTGTVGAPAVSFGGAPAVSFGVDYVVPGNASITFVYFVAVFMLTVLAARFTYYAGRSWQANDRAALRTLWWSLTVAGIAAVVYGLLAVVDVVSTLSTPFRRGFLLAHVVGIGFAIQTLGREAQPGTRADAPVAFPTGFWLGAVVAVVLVLVGTATLFDSAVVVLVEGLVGLAIAVVGIAIARDGLATTRVQGTVIDTLLRHLFPVLLFAAMIPITGLAVVVGDVAGIDPLTRTVALHIQVVFVIMTATALMTATIRLRQNLAGL